MKNSSSIEIVSVEVGGKAHKVSECGVKRWLPFNNSERYMFSKSWHVVIHWRRCCLSPISSHVMCRFIMIEIPNASIMYPFGRQTTPSASASFCSKCCIFCVFFVFLDWINVYIFKNPSNLSLQPPKTGGSYSILFLKKPSRDFCSPLPLTQCSPPFFSGEPRLKAVLTWRMCSHPWLFTLPRLQVAACPWKVGSKTFLQQFSGVFFDSTPGGWAG